MYGKYDVIPRTVRTGDSAEVAVDVNARLLVDTGGGTPGVPSGSVQSVQGVVGGQMVPVEVVDSTGTPLNYTLPAPVQVQKVTGQTTWTKTTVVMTGASINLIGANINRVGVRWVNRIGNAQIDVDIAGGTVAANTGWPYLSGQGEAIMGADTPVGAITVFGTSAQTVNVWEAT